MSLLVRAWVDWNAAADLRHGPSRSKSERRVLVSVVQASDGGEDDSRDARLLLLLKCATADR